MSCKDMVDALAQTPHWLNYHEHDIVQPVTFDLLKFPDSVVQ